MSNIFVICFQNRIQVNIELQKSDRDYRVKDKNIITSLSELFYASAAFVNVTVFDNKDVKDLTKDIVGEFSSIYSAEMLLDILFKVKNFR